MSTTITNPFVYAPAQAITGEATGSITRGKLVKVSGNRTASGNLAVAQAAAGDRALGVAADDAEAGDLVRIARGGVVKAICVGAIAAGASVQAGTGGAVATASSGVVVGLAVNGAADGEIAEIAFYA
jgi:hypothetical protein